MSKVQFILKRKENYGVANFHEPRGLSTGLLNSASYVSDMLNSIGISSEIDIAVDNNCIDRIVTQHKPSVVIIEALWVVPEKFEILQKLHPNIRWIVRLHSEVPFMAQEGIAFAWITDYLKYKNVYVGVNSPRMVKSLINLHLNSEGAEDKFLFMPNYYPILNTKTKVPDYESEELNIGCFGAVRPLKNHIHQALAAIYFADKENKKLNFHINADRLEMKGEPVLHNLRRMFDRQEQHGHKLVEHAWQPREEFLELCGQMDVGMQVSFSETFNIVGADLINQGIPVVSSSEIPWAVGFFGASPVDQDSIERGLSRAYHCPRTNRYLNFLKLHSYSEISLSVWKKLFSNV